MKSLKIKTVMIAIISNIISKYKESLNQNYLLDILLTIFLAAIVAALAYLVSLIPVFIFYLCYLILINAVLLTYYI